MALIVGDRVKDTTTSTGTGALTLSGTAPLGFRPFSAVMANNDTAYITVVDTATGAWESSFATYSTTGPTLTRTRFIASSTGAAVSFGAGAKEVFLTFGQEQARSIPKPTIANAAATLTTEQFLARWTFPANFFLPDDGLLLNFATQTAAATALTFRCRIGVNGGTTGDQVVAVLTASANQAANAHQGGEFRVRCLTTGAAGTFSGNGFCIAQAAVLGTPTAAFAAATSSTTVPVTVSLSVVEGGTAGIVNVRAANLFLGNQ